MDEWVSAKQILFEQGAPISIGVAGRPLEDVAKVEALKPVGQAVAIGIGSRIEVNRFGRHVAVKQDLELHLGNA